MHYITTLESSVKSNYIQTYFSGSQYHHAESSLHKLKHYNVECGKHRRTVLLNNVVEFLWCLIVFRSPHSTLTMSSGFNCMCIIRQFFIMWCYNLQSELSLMMVVAATKTC